MARGDLQVQDLRVIMLLAQARVPLTTNQISEKLDLPLRTVQRIINAIEAIPLPLKRDAPGMGGGIRLQGDLSLRVSLPSNLVELASLQVAREHMRKTAGDTLLSEALEQFVDRTLALMTAEQREISEKFARLYRTKAAKPGGTASAVATTVHRAMDAGVVLVIEYVSPGTKKAKRRRIEPAGVWISDERTYVVGVDQEKKALRTFALDRIETATLTETKFSPQRDFDVAVYFQHAVGAFVGSGPVNLEFALDAEAVRRLGKKRPQGSTLAENKDGTATLRYAAPLSDELLAWMVHLGPGVRVTAPESAVSFVREGFRSRAS